MIIAGGDANVVLDVLHPDCAVNSIAREFENLILVEHKLTLVNIRCPRRTHTIHALVLMAHSPGINIVDFFVHDGLECPCGKTRCGAIAGSDLLFVSATLDLHRPAESNALNGFKVHFGLLASWINVITSETRCANREERQALVNCISFAWYVITYGALANAWKW